MLEQLLYDGRVCLPTTTNGFSVVENYNNSRTLAVRNQIGNRSRHRFTREEDEQLMRLVEGNPGCSWDDIAKCLPGRTSRQVRERYRHYLSPELNLSQWTSEEDNVLRNKFDEYGPQWSILKMFFPNRSAVNIKNHWTTMISRESRQAWETRTAVRPLQPESQSGPESESESDPRPSIPSSSPIILLTHDQIGANQSTNQQQIRLHQQQPQQNENEREIDHGNEGDCERLIDIFDVDLFGQPRFPMSDMFNESFAS
jgi:hypothetical protein